MPLGHVIWEEQKKREKTKATDRPHIDEFTVVLLLPFIKLQVQARLCLTAILITQDFFG